MLSLILKIDTFVYLGRMLVKDGKMAGEILRWEMPLGR